MDILTSLDYNIKVFKDLFDKKDLYTEEIQRREREIEQYADRLTFLKNTRELYLTAVDVMYQESIGVLQETLDTALQYIMTDKDYSVKLDLEDKRGVKTLNLSLMDNEEGFEADLKDSTGGGVRTIISTILKLYYLVSEGSKVLFLDEKLSALSSQYVPYMFEFLQRMCDERGLIIVLVTHDTRFVNYGVKVYNVADGVVKEDVEEDGINDLEPNI